MNIEEIRIYSEVLEQGIDFKDYVKEFFNGKIQNIYSKKARGCLSPSDTLIDRIRKLKDVDVLISAISCKKEYPLLMVEYSTAVPTDDHKMQRSDVYYWSGALQVPVMKIYPSKKGMGQDFGGGDKISDDVEKVISYKNGTVFYPINWETIEGFDVLETKPDRLSCIAQNNEIFQILDKLFSYFSGSSSYFEFYKMAREDFYSSNKALFDNYTIDKVKALITNSSRFNWKGDNLTAKINRFGHAMDPDRGVLYFVNMMVGGASNLTTEIQVNRPKEISARGGYKSLFDASPNEKLLLEYVKNIIQEKGNKFCDEDALFVLRKGLNLPQSLLFAKASEHEYLIDDANLAEFLNSCPSITTKCIFYLSTKLILTDENRNVICSIRWSEEPIKEYLGTISCLNYGITPIKPISRNEVKEDLVTFGSIELYKKLGCSLLAVSYPGAQGDRAIITGSGRTNLRTYVDVIAYKNVGNLTYAYLTEAKDTFVKSVPDCEKLNNLVKSSEMICGLERLFEKTIGNKNIAAVKTSLAARDTFSLPSFTCNYIFKFDITQMPDSTCLNYSIDVHDVSLLEFFAPLKGNGKYSGCIILDKLFIISD